MRYKVICHGSRHRPSFGRRKFRELRAAGDDALTFACEVDPEMNEWDQWSDDPYQDDLDDFEVEPCFGLDRDGSARLLGGPLSGTQIQQLLTPSLRQQLEELPVDGGPVSSEGIVEWEPLSSDELIERLLERCRKLRETKNWEVLLTVPDEELLVLRGFWQSSDSQLTHRTAPPGYCLPYQLGLIAMLEPFWVRPAVSWRMPEGSDRERFASLLEHLFMLYPVPRVLLEGVEWVADCRTAKWMLWVVIMGSGASMTRAGRRIGWWANSAFLAQLMKAPPNLDATSACIWAEVQRIGGPVEVATVLCADPSFRIDPTEVYVPESPAAGYLRGRSETEDWEIRYRERHQAQKVAFRQFWQATLEWLVRNQENLEVDALPRILSWANHEFTEYQRFVDQTMGFTERERREFNAGGPFSWKGRTVAATLRAANEYEQRIRRRQKLNRRWKTKGWNWETTDETGAQWTMRELATSDELAEEGEAMHHCVGGYDACCARGISAVFSLLQDGERLLTIEIDVASRNLRQAYGSWNRMATAEEMAIVKRWKTEIVEAVDGSESMPVRFEF